MIQYRRQQACRVHFSPSDIFKLILRHQKRQYTWLVLEVFLFSFQKRRKQLQRLRWRIRHLLCPCNSRSLGLFLMLTLIWFFISTILNSTTLTNISANVVLILYIVVNVVFLTFVITGSHVILMILFFLSNQAPGNETVKHSHHCHQLLEKPRPSCSVWLKWSVTSPQDPASLPDGSLWKLNKQTRDGLNWLNWGS